MKKSVSFKNKEWNVAANIFFPPDFKESATYPAIVCVHPGSSVKEQTAGLYAEKLARNDFITLAFDASFQGESGGEPRHLEDPATRVEDIKCAVDFLTTLPYVHNDRMGVLGICAGGAYAANSALTEKRLKAVATVSASNFCRAYKEGETDILEILENVGRQRTAQANGGSALIVNWTPESHEALQQAGITETDITQAVDYYRTSRGGHERSDNKLLFTSMGNTIAFDAFHLADYLLTQPLLVIVGDKVGAFGSYRDGYTLFNKAASKNKTIHVVKGAGHYDLYDRPEPVAEALAKLVPFFTENL